MSNRIKISSGDIETRCRELAQMLGSAKLVGGKLNISVNTPETNEKAVVTFTSMAWGKMITLLCKHSEEVAWHGVVRRSDDADNEYIIDDIMVYPQTVTGTTVSMDEAAYSQWVIEGDDDRLFNIHMQGHSHVNMGTTPSGVDLTHQEIILDQLRGDSFYIFMIWNKSLSRHIVIYDMAKNIYYENKDVSVNVPGVDECMDEAVKLVKKHTYAPHAGSYLTPYTKTVAGGYNPVKAPVINSAKALPESKPKTTISGAASNLYQGYEYAYYDHQSGAYTYD